MNVRLITFTLILIFNLGIRSVHAEINEAKIREWKSVTLRNGLTREWLSVTRVTDTGFTFTTSTGVGNVKFEDLTDETQKEIGFDPTTILTPVLTPPMPGTGVSAKPGAEFDMALKQAIAQQSVLKSEIAQLRAEAAKSKAANPGYSSSTTDNQIKRKEAEIKIWAQQGKVIQEQKNAALINANIKPTGSPKVDTAVATASSIKTALAQKKIKKQQIILEMMRSELLQPGGSGSFQTQLSYIDRDLTALQAEVKAAEAGVQAAKAGAAVR